MKLTIIVLVVFAMVLTLSAERNAGRRSNIRFQNLIKNQKDSPSVGRMFHKKGQQQAAPTYVIVVQDSSPSSSSLSSSTSPIDFTITGTVTQNRSLSMDDDVEFNDDDDDDDIKDSNINDQPLRYKKQSKNLKPAMKLSGKDKEYKLVVPARNIQNLEKNTHHVRRSPTFKRGVNKLRMIQLNDNSSRKRKNVDFKRLVVEN